MCYIIWNKCLFPEFFKYVCDSDANRMSERGRASGRCVYGLRKNQAIKHSYHIIERTVIISILYRFI